MVPLAAAGGLPRIPRLAHTWGVGRTVADGAVGGRDVLADRVALGRMGSPGAGRDLRGDDADRRALRPLGLVDAGRGADRYLDGATRGGWRARLGGARRDAVAGAAPGRPVAMDDELRSLGREPRELVAARGPRGPPGFQAGGVSKARPRNNSNCRGRGFRP